MRFRVVLYIASLPIVFAGCGGGGSFTSPVPPGKTEPARPTLTFTAAPSTINQGASTTLSWTSSNATSVSVDNGIGTVGLNDSRQVTPNADTTYTATATGAGGSATATVSVTVIQPPSAGIVLNPATIKAGTTTTLSWNSSNAASVAIDNGIGPVPPAGSRVISADASTTYKITASSPAGTATAIANLTVVLLPAITLSAAPNTINPGESTTLSWTSSNTDRVIVDNNIGEQPANGSVSISPASTTVYTATASGPGGTAASTFKVTVTNPLLPTVTLTATPQSLSAGEAATLTWTSTNGTSAQINNGVGNVALNGSIQVSPGSTKTFTISVLGTQGAASADATVTVASSVATAFHLKHIVVVMMQNSSFDHLFGVFPAANGNTVEGLSRGVPGYSQMDSSGQSVSPFLLTNIAPPALPEGNTAYRQVLDNGAMDKFALYNGDISMGYYDNTTPGVGTLWQLAQQFALADRYFGSVVGEAPTNQLYMVAAADLDRTFDVQPAFGPCQIADNSAQPYTFPNVADQLSAKGLGWGVFQQNFADCSVFMGIHDPFQFFTSTHDSSNVQGYSNFLAQIQNDTLPAFSLVIPDSNHDMHPGNGPITNGINFLQDLITQVQGSPVWNSTAIIITFDTGGGWYDHVPPPTVDSQGLAFRVPTLVISPYAKKNYVSHTVMDHVSILKLVQSNWGLPSLNQRNAASNDMLDMFDFTQAVPHAAPQ